MIKLLVKHLPFTYMSIIKQHMRHDAKTVLDVACGDGVLSAFLNEKNNLLITGVDSYKPFLALAKKKKVYDKLIIQDVMHMKFLKQSYDVVLCSQLLMYLSKTDAVKLIKQMETIAKKQVIIGLPQGDIGHKNAQGNKWQTSKSGWTYQDFQAMGYKVYGQGFNKVYKEEGYHPKTMGIGTLVGMLFAYSVSPIVYLVPQLGSHMICIKNVDNV